MSARSYRLPILNKQGVLFQVLIQTTVLCSLTTCLLFILQELSPVLYSINSSLPLTQVVNQKVSPSLPLQVPTKSILTSTRLAPQVSQSIIISIFRFMVPNGTIFSANSLTQFLARETCSGSRSPPQLRSKLPNRS